MPPLYNNTVSRIPTRFLRGVELVEVGRKDYGVASENWTYPFMSFGDHGDEYYAEIWKDGMDWQNTYWLLEQTHGECPVRAYPAARFPDHHPNLEEFDLRNLLRAMMWFRRDEEWIKSGDQGAFNDQVWAFLTVEGRSSDHLVQVHFKSAAWDARFETVPSLVEISTRPRQKKVRQPGEPLDHAVCGPGCGCDER